MSLKKYIIFINIVVSSTGLEIVMLNKQNLLYKFMKQTKKYDINDIIYLETSELFTSHQD